MDSYVSVLPQDVVVSLLTQLDAPDTRLGLRFLRLPHPRTGVPSLYLPYKSSRLGRYDIVEVQMIAPPNARSWLFEEGEVSQDGRLLMMTPVDPAFLLIPILEATIPADGNPGTFRPMDDVFEDATKKYTRAYHDAANENDPSLRLSSNDLHQFFTLDVTRAAMNRICEVKEITQDITVYRYSRAKVIENMKSKVTRLVTPEVFECSKALTRGLAKDGLMEDGMEDLLTTGRLRAACDLLSQYLPSDVFSVLLTSYDFEALGVHLKALADEAAEATAAKMDNLSVKEKSKSKSKEDKAAANANDKKRKATLSHGVQQLKKANTRGMAKLSSFFQPKMTS